MHSLSLERLDQILARAVTPIGPEETSADLFARLREMGRDTLLRVLDDLEAGCARPEPQDHAASTPAPKLRKEDGKLDFSLPAQALHDHVRAFNPYPVCYAAQAGTGRILRVHATRPVDAAPLRAGDAEDARPGDARIGTDRHPYVATGKGWLMLREVQWEGKPRVAGPDFVNGLQPAEREGLRFE